MLHIIEIFVNPKYIKTQTVAFVIYFAVAAARNRATAKHETVQPYWPCNTQIVHPTKRTGPVRSTRQVCRALQLETLGTNARNQLAAVDIKHIYVNDYRQEDTKEELRVTLRKGEDKWVYFWTSFNSEANPRTLYIRFDGERVLASMASYSVFHNSITVSTSRTWSCLNWSLKKGQYGYRDFPSYSSYRRSSGFKYYTDRVDI